MIPRRLARALLASGLLTQQIHIAPVIAAETNNGGDVMTEKQVLTPGGLRPDSQVHEIAPGHVLDSSGGRLRELDADGHVVAEFGPAPDATPSDPAASGKKPSDEKR